ncbi:unnamed protein product [Mytilus edulis]|uniref:Uncharacterized protein n=1 Tax=Mytilus edulis TaxID=6550 RepID=A0A8S3ULS8_MYTED|nr:unnamed protein product [Mytilus edulis]
MEVVENIKRLCTNWKYNLKSLENKNREIEVEIKENRTKINLHLDKLQDNLKKELMTVEQKESRKIEKMLTTSGKKEKEITDIQVNNASIKQKASELKTFLTIKDIAKEVAAEEKFIESLTTSNTFNHVDVSYQINKTLQQITASVQKFEDICVSSDPCHFIIQKLKNRQGSMPARTIDKLRYFVTLQKRFNTGLSDVQVCVLLPDGRMIFSCYEQDKIAVFESNGSKDFEINNIGYTFDVVFIGDDSIAVSSGESDTIHIIDLKKQKLKKSIKVHTHNEGLVYIYKHLIYCAGEKGLQMVNLSDESITNVSKNKLPYGAYVTTFRNKLFFTNPDNNSVTCCDYHGNILWTFCDTSVLKCPLGISVDISGNVFVVGCYTHSVFVISSDGHYYSQILSREDGLKFPQVLHYDQSTNQILVVNTAIEAFVYGVK